MGGSSSRKLSKTFSMLERDSLGIDPSDLSNLQKVTHALNLIQTLESKQCMQHSFAAGLPRHMSCATQSALLPSLSDWLCANCITNDWV